MKCRDREPIEGFFVPLAFFAFGPKALDFNRFREGWLNSIRGIELSSR